MQIANEILEQLNISEYVAKERFFSRRNEVYKIEALCSDNRKIIFVYKCFLNGALEREYENLNKLSGIRVPKVIARSKNALCLEYLNGRTLLEALELLESRDMPFDVCIHSLVDFMECFYKTLPGYIYEDINFRNFISKPDGVYGIDLEEAGPGKKERDVGRMAAFMLTYEPAHTVYKKIAAQMLIKEFVSRFGIREDLVDREIEKEFARMKERRANKEGMVGGQDGK